MNASEEYDKTNEEDNKDDLFSVVNERDHDDNLVQEMATGRDKSFDEVEDRDQDDNQVEKGKK